MKKIFITVLAVIALIAAGCAQESETQAISIQFGELWDKEMNVSQRVKELDGEAIAITGFMAMQSPLDGSFIYLTNAPLISCPYCLPGSDRPIIAIPAIASAGKPIKFTEQPVTVRGTLEVEEKSDEYGYTTPFRINIDNLSVADASKMPQALKEYTMLTSDGVITDVLDIIYLLAGNTRNNPNRYTPSDIKAVDVKNIVSLTNQVKGYGVASFEPLEKVLEATKELSVKINEHIKNDEEEKLPEYYDMVILIWNAYFEWANEMAVME